MAQGSGKDGPFTTAHKAAASLLAAGPDMHPVGINPALNTLQDPIQRNTATLTHAVLVLTDAASVPCSEIISNYIKHLCITFASQKHITTIYTSLIIMVKNITVHILK